MILVKNIWTAKLSVEYKANHFARAWLDGYQVEADK